VTRDESDSAREQISWWLWFGHSLERVTQRSFDQVENSKYGVALGLHPRAKIFAEFPMKDCLAISRNAVNKRRAL
jgi:hypothetical protein